MGSTARTNPALSSVKRTCVPAGGMEGSGVTILREVQPGPGRSRVTKPRSFTRAMVATTVFDEGSGSAYFERFNQGRVAPGDEATLVHASDGRDDWYLIRMPFLSSSKAR